jgi:hypothetical protein
MGYDTADIPYISLAEKLGVGVGGPAVVRELNSPADAQAGSAGLGDSGHRPGGKVRQLARYIDESEACSACYAALIFALSRMDHRDLGRLPGKIACGQGFRGKNGALGVGRCTGAFAASCPGCPPGGAGVLTFLRSQIETKRP